MGYLIRIQFGFYVHNLTLGSKVNAPYNERTLLIPTVGSISYGLH